MQPTTEDQKKKKRYDLFLNSNLKHIFQGNVHAIYTVQNNHLSQN